MDSLSFKLPNGKITKSVKRYCKAWKDIYDPICKATGSTVIGFDPDILFKAPTGKNFDLPLSIACKIAKMIEALKLVVKQNRAGWDTITLAKASITPPPIPVPKTSIIGKEWWGRKPVRKGK